MTPLFFPLLCPVFNHFLTPYIVFWCSVAQSVSDFLQPHGLQHPRLPCPSLSPRVCSNSYPFSWWYHPTISSSVTSFSSWPYSFPASGSFPMSQLFTLSGQSIGASASISVLPVNFQGWFPLGLTGFISLLSKGLSSPWESPVVSFLAPQFERRRSAFFMVQLSHPYIKKKNNHLENGYEHMEKP